MLKRRRAANKTQHPLQNVLKIETLIKFISWLRDNLNILLRKTTCSVYFAEMVTFGKFTVALCEFLKCR